MIIYLCLYFVPINLLVRKGILSPHVAYYFNIPALIHDFHKTYKQLRFYKTNLM